MTSLELKLLETVLQIIDDVQQYSSIDPEESAELFICAKSLNNILEDNGRG